MLVKSVKVKHCLCTVFFIFVNFFDLIKKEKVLTSLRLKCKSWWVKKMLERSSANACSAHRSSLTHVIPRATPHVHHDPSLPQAL